MALHTMVAIVREMLAYRMDHSVLCWGDCEPTMCGLDFFKAAVEAEKRYGADGQVVGNALNTNGLLIDDAWCEFLAQYHFLVALWLDGPREIHERYRGKCFDKAMRAARLMRQHGVEFNIMTVVSQANVRQGAEVYEWFVGQGFREIQFIPCHDTDQHGRLVPHAISGEDFGQFLLAAFERWYPRDVGVVNERVFNNLLSHFASGEPNLCTFRSRCGDYLCIDQQGTVFPCIFYLEQEHRIGEIGERPLHEFYTARTATFGKLKAQVANECRVCPYLSMCNGGCPRDRGPDGRSLDCPGLKRFFAVAAPRLRGLAEQLKRIRQERKG